MDGENNGKPYEQMDDLGGFPTPIFGSTPIEAQFLEVVGLSAEEKFLPRFQEVERSLGSWNLF